VSATVPEALSPFVGSDGQLDHRTDGGYPIRYIDSAMDELCPACAQLVFEEGEDAEYPLIQGEVFWEADDPECWPQCEGCHENLEVAYPPDGFDKKGQPSGQPRAPKARRQRAVRA
jgi:hypothetical protein